MSLNRGLPVPARPAGGRQAGGFSFGDKHSSLFNIAVESISRGLLPAKKAETQGFEVTGRHGNVAYNQPIYDVRTISIDIAFLDNTPETLQKRARAIAHWLSATEQLLYFDDEPDLAYTASIFEQIDTAEIITAKKATLNFTCQPFATSINYFQKDYNNLTYSP